MPSQPLSNPIKQWSSAPLRPTHPPTIPPPLSLPASLPPNPCSQFSPLKIILITISIIITYHICKLNGLLLLLFPMMVCLKKCLFDSTDTKRNSKEWSRKVVTCFLEKINHFSNSMKKKKKNHGLMFIAFVELCLSCIFSTGHWRPRPEDCVVKQASSTDTLRRHNNSQLCSNILFTSGLDVCAPWAELHYKFILPHVHMWLSKEMWMSSHWHNSTIISTKLHAVETKHDHVL